MAMSRLLEAVRVADDADAAIDAALDGLVAELGADRGFLMLSVHGGESVLRARDAQGDLPISEHEELSRTIVRRAKTEGRAVYWDGVDDAAGGSLGELGILAAIAVPLRAPAPAPEGVLYVDVRELGKSFGPAHERFVALAATVIAPLLRDASRFRYAPPTRSGRALASRSGTGAEGRGRASSSRCAHCRSSLGVGDARRR